ncbi:tripartite tricarboxylate transporter TctB family protein [Saccharomonospora sp. NPDC046836]|uniref:tripartite tricarboxylate transporter TctB family protein n=1 Tax=Saccharomonospora sp. NPDC046836 TaxID=3156921 RepID=UPI0033E0524A
MRKPGSTVVASGGIVVMFAALLVVALGYPYMVEARGSSRPGPGFFPVWILGILVALSIVNLVQEIRKRVTETRILPSGQSLLKLVKVFGSVVLFVALAPFAGFTIACALFLFLIYCFANGFGWLRSAGLSVGISIALFVLFRTLLGVQLPVNALGW